ncbi:hypothetical protein [uncultured Thomasclavelia sp.]|uniref:hypothetical protein n=1 Tax=uncultured Thomasclavelia sp. TaxID=3025759 RepID=UPI0025F305D6|nr:hypothetical protein [uncultured Thomasclavelia sp.]
MKKQINNNDVVTDHNKNLDYIQDNYPELLNDYINLYENSIFACDEILDSKDIIDILLMIKDLENEKYKTLN